MTAIVFDYIIPIRRKAVARKSDPQVSHDAAKRVELGKAQLQRQFIYWTLEEFGGMTVTELAISSGEWSDYELGKRIGEVQGIATTGEKRGGMRVWGLV
jgi:hypothetical protein